MMRLNNIYISLLTFAMSALWACSDYDFSGIDPDEPGALTISMNSSALQITSRGDNPYDGNAEFAINDVKFYFYLGTSENPDAEAPVLMRAVSNTATEYGSQTVTLKLSDADIAKVFPDDKTECQIYAVANLTDVGVSISDNATIDEIKKTPLSRDFSKGVSSFVMTAQGTVVLDRATTTMSSTLTLERAAAKATLTIKVLDEVKVKDDDGNEQIYEPVLSETGVIASLMNGANVGYIDYIDSENQTYTTKLDDYESYYTDKQDNDADSSDNSNGYTTRYQSTPFYCYPSKWTTNQSTVDTSIVLRVPWRLQGTQNYSTYYYQIPLSLYEKLIERNKYYKITLKVGMLGSPISTEPYDITEDQISYEVASWNDDGIGLNATLTRAHYLVVSDNAFKLWNDSELSFEYNTCSDVTVYLSSVKYVSTTSGVETEVDLLTSDYDKATGTYTQTMSDSGTSAEEYIKENLEKIVTVSEQTVGDSENSGAGKVKFNSDVQLTAGQLYRPVIYTITLVNKHSSIRQNVTITQYPSKYIEYGVSGNVFVNGYYARLAYSSTMPSGSVKNYAYSNSGNNTWTKTNQTTGYYRSLPFVYNNFTQTRNASTSGYNYSSTTDATAESIYGLRSRTGTFKYSSINTSYEYVQGEPQSTMTLDKTVDVHVSAFTSKDNSFKVNKGGTTAIYYYRIGDPRVYPSPKYTAFSHTGTNDNKYIYTGTMIYDYYTYASGNNRYLTSWGDKATEIKIGSEDEDYDDVIAPVYKIQSPYGALAGWAYYEVAQKRCATYQEAGYPAGRWRLPTLAEVEFIISLQEQGVIENLFTTGNEGIGYWTASGGNILADGTYYENYNSNSSHYAWVRCVYDLWYWGDNPKSPSDKYYPLPTKE